MIICICYVINYAGIVIAAYSPLGSPGRPGRTRQDTDPIVMEDPVINEIAKKHGVTAARVSTV